MQTYHKLQKRAVLLHDALLLVPDFYVEIRVELNSWVPLVSHVLPSDTLRIWKKGAKIRCDFTIKELQGTTWKRGQLSHILLAKPEGQGHSKFT